MHEPRPPSAGPRSPRTRWPGRKPFLDFLIGLFAVAAALVALLPFLAVARGAVSAIQEGFHAPQSVGVGISLVALCLGSIFFLYSVKYYLATLAMLLSALLLSNGGGHSNGSAYANGNGHPHGLMRLLRRGKGNVDGNGDGHFDLGYEPFVSIHIAIYNEKRVIGRLLEACAALEYGSYEVIVVDDSTDETTSILEAWRGRPGFKLIHRPSRDGFKGGALKVALEHTDARAEFVIVWDADVVPFPDSIQTYLPHFFKTSSDGNGNGGGDLAKQPPEPRPEVAAVQSYQWHVLNKSESWLTEAVRAEYAGSYMVERPFQEFIGSLKMVAGTAFMIRAKLLREIGWGRSLTEDWELTLRLYARGYKVVYTPYAESPAECVATVGRLVRQRMRWAEGHSYNVRRQFAEIMGSPHLGLLEKVEFIYYSTYYLQAALFVVGSTAWLFAEIVIHARVPEWTSTLGWSLLLSNLLSLPVMNSAGLLLEDAPAKDFVGVLGALATSFLLVPFQAYAALKGFVEHDEGPWYRTPKTGRITDPIKHLHQLKWLRRWLGPRGRRLGSMPANAVGSPRPRPASRLGWIGVAALVLAMSWIGYGAAHAPIVEAAGTSLFLHGAGPFTMDTTSPVGAVQTLDMTSAGATRTWGTTTPTNAVQTILSSSAFTFNYWTAAAPSGTSNVTLSLGYSSSPCRRAVANVQSGPEVQINSGNVTATLPAPSAAGDLLVATVVGGNNVAAFAGPAGWIKAASVGQAGDGEVEIWFLANSPAGVTAATFTSASAVSIGQMSEWSGASLTTPLDRTGTATSAANVTSTTVSTSAANATAGDLGITATTWTSGTFTSGGGWSTMYHDNPIASASDFQLGLPAAVASETVTSTAATLWADVIATFSPAAIVPIAQSTATLSSAVAGLSTAAFSPASNVTVPAGSFLCFTVLVNSAAGGGLVLDYDAAATPTNLNSTQTIFIPELVLPFIGLAVLAPLAGRLRRHRGRRGSDS